MVNKQVDRKLGLDQRKNKENSKTRRVAPYSRGHLITNLLGIDPPVYPQVQATFVTSLLPCFPACVSFYNKFFLHTWVDGKLEVHMHTHTHTHTHYF